MQLRVEKFASRTIRPDEKYHHVDGGKEGITVRALEMAEYPHINISSSTKYVMSLDAVDLSLLPIKYQPPLINNNVVIWSPNSLNNDYFEFEIKCPQYASSPEKKEDYDISENKAHIVCHICTTLVPRAYIKEHLKSSKHISYQNITTTALNRTALSLNRAANYLKEEKRQKSKLDYFCENCVSVVRLSNRVDHEQSKKHKNFVALDRFLNNFSLFYTNTASENYSELDKYESIRSKTEVSFLKVNKKAVHPEYGFDCNENIEVAMENLNLVEESTAINIKLKEASDLINNIESCIENTHNGINNNNIDVNNEEANIVNNLKQYIKLVKKYGKVKLESLNSGNQDHVRIETLDSCEVIVSLNNFHGFKKTGKKYVHCKLCKVFVSNVNDHIVSEKHIQIIAQPLENQNCLRKLDDTQYHCVVCNEVINNPEVHVLFNEHTKKVEQSLSPKIDSKTFAESEAIVASKNALSVMDLVKNEFIAPKIESASDNIRNNDTENDTEDSESVQENKNMNLFNTSEYFCSICNKYMHVNNMDNHNTGTKHIANANKLFIDYLMKRNNSLLTCRICDINVSRYTWAVKDHIALPDHIAKYYQVLAENKINECDKSFFCKPCSVTLPKMSELHHISTQNHQLKLASYNINYIASIDQHKLIEKNNKVGNIHSEISSSTVSNNTVDTDKETQTKCETLYQCDACNEQFENKPEIIKRHNESANHKIMHVLLSKVNTLLEELLKHFNNPPELHYQLERAEDNEVKCKICPEARIEDAEKHINSLKHVHNHRSLMEANKLKLKEDRYVCYVCNVFVEESKELCHIETDLHVERLESIKNGDYVLVAVETKNLIEKIFSQLKVVESKRDSTVTALEFGDFIPWNKRLEFNINNGDHFKNLVDNDTEIICVLCHVVIENTEKAITLHTNELVHKLNYKDVMSYNQIYRIKNGFVCGYCECVFYGSEFDHIMDIKHEDSYNKDPKKNFCFKCNVSTIDIEAKHLTSIEHIRIITSSPTLHYCNICNIKLSNSETNIQRHNDGFQHKNNCSLMEQNKLILKNKKCYCQVCESRFNRDCLESHIGSTNHLMLLEP